MGKLRVKIELPLNFDKDQVEAEVKNLDLSKWTEGKPFKKVIVVHGKNCERGGVKYYHLWNSYRYLVVTPPSTSVSVAGNPCSSSLKVSTLC